MTPYYDPLLAKIVAHGAHRDAAITSMRRALTGLIIEGIHTNIGLHQRIMDNAQFQAGEVDTDFLARVLLP